MKLDAVKTAIGLMGEYVRLSEILENVRQGIKLEVYLESGDDIGHIEGMTEGIINRITDARNTIRSKLKYSFNIPVEVDEPELPFNGGARLTVCNKADNICTDKTCTTVCKYPPNQPSAIPPVPVGSEGFPRHHYGCPCGACSGAPDRWSNDRPGAPVARAPGA